MSEDRWLTPQEWLESLEPPARAEADRRIALLSRLGASDPVGWVSSEMRENIPQTARFLALRALRAIMDDLPFTYLGFTRETAAKVEKTLDLSKIESDGSASFKRLVETGGDVQDILRVARIVRVQTVLEIIDSFLDEPYDSTVDKNAPGWALAETDGEGHLTGRFVEALHESVFDVFEGDMERQR